MTYRHGITNPSENDVVYIPDFGTSNPGKLAIPYIRESSAAPAPARVTSVKKGNIICKHCKSSKNPRIFMERGVIDHIKAV